jgi:hypothetical protein
MNPQSASKHAARLAVVAAAFVFGSFLLPNAAQACCTAVVCNYCISGSDDCVCGSTTPVCNVAGCNCNAQCGQNTFSTSGSCTFFPRCDSATAKAGAEKRFAEIDADRDGRISSVELAGWGQKQKTPLAKRVDKASLPANLKAASDKEIFVFAFAEVDLDKDGYIQPAELDSSLAPASK